jgi:hypothetical protein
MLKKLAKNVPDKHRGATPNIRIVNNASDTTFPPNADHPGKPLGSLLSHSFFKSFNI